MVVCYNATVSILPFKEICLFFQMAFLSLYYQSIALLFKERGKWYGCYFIVFNVYLNLSPVGCFICPLIQRLAATGTNVKGAAVAMYGTYDFFRKGTTIHAAVVDINVTPGKPLEDILQSIRLVKTYIAIGIPVF